jgi:hypothetical protein
MNRKIFIAAIASLVPTFCLGLDARAQIMTPAQIYTAPYGTIPNPTLYYPYGTSDQGSYDSQYFQGNDDDSSSSYYTKDSEQDSQSYSEDDVLRDLDYVRQQFMDVFKYVNPQPDY